MPRPRVRVQRADALCRLLTVVLPAEFGKGLPACTDEDPELFFPVRGADGADHRGQGRVCPVPAGGVVSGLCAQAR